MGETITGIEAKGEVGCAYLDCPVLPRCRRNKTVLIARVQPNEEAQLDQLVADWTQATESPCYQDDNANNGRMVEIQHFPKVEKSLIYCR